MSKSKSSKIRNRNDLSFRREVQTTMNGLEIRYVRKMRTETGIVRYLFREVGTNKFHIFRMSAYPILRPILCSQKEMDRVGCLQDHEVRVADVNSRIISLERKMRRK